MYHDQPIDSPIEKISDNTIHIWSFTHQAAQTQTSEKIIYDVLSHYLKKSDIKINRNKNGKPYLVDSNLHFNLSHSSSSTLIGVATRPLGVDIEKQKKIRNYLSISKRFFHPKEYQIILKSNEKETHFLTIWTKKESWIKARGSTIAKDIKKEIPTSLSKKDKNRWYFHELKLNAHIGTVCCQYETPTIIYKETL